MKQKATYWSVLGLACMVLVSSYIEGAQAQENPGFDFEHIRGALEYFDQPSERGIANVAFTRAAEHLKDHSLIADTYPADANTFHITRDLLSERPSEGTLATVKAMMMILSEDQPRQDVCYTEARAYLPDGVRLDDPLYITWGYDIGVATPGAASINLTHPHFQNDANEVWYYCIHELHHAGLMQLNPFPYRISEIENTAELLALIEYATMLEGSAVYAAMEARKNDGALLRDDDYVALMDHQTMQRNFSQYNSILALYRGEVRPVVDADWDRVELLSGGERLWYRVGAAMASAIDHQLGRDTLKKALAGGPASFFAAYDRTTRQN